MSQSDWQERLNLFLQATGTELLRDAGKVTALEAKIHAESEYEKFRIVQDKVFASDFDKFLTELDNG